MNRDLFPVLEPPSGGLQRLQARMERPRRAWAGWLAVPAIAAAAVLAVVALGPTAAPLDGDLPARAAAGPAAAGRDGTAVAALPTASAGIALYLVSGAASATQPSPTQSPGR